MRRRYAAAALVAAACAFPAVALAAPAKKITVGDDYFGPTKVTVKRGTTVKWVWDDYNMNSHNVKLKSAPKGVKKFRSASAASGYTFSRKLTKRGTYKFVCTLHQDMAMTIKVK